MRALAFGAKVSVLEGVDEVRRAWSEGLRVWVDLETTSPETDALLVDTFAVHSLTMEDLWGERSLPKISDYDNYLHVCVHGIRAGSQPTDVGLFKIDILFSERFVLTIHSGSRSVQTVFDEAQRNHRVDQWGMVWLAHSILDHLVDHYLPVIESLDELTSELEDDVIAKAGTPDGPEVMNRIFVIKRSLYRIRRIAFHQREILFRLSRAEFDEIPREALPFFRDVYDHFARVTDLTESNRERVAGTLEAFLSVQSNRMNEVMKGLTIISTLMLPLSFIASLYGMNFKRMPELEWDYGYPYVLLLMAAVGAGVLILFRRRGWF